MEEGDFGRFIHVTQEYFELNKEDKITYLIRLLLPWLVDFVNSWDSPSPELDELNVLTLYYRDMVRDPCQHFKKILNFYNIPEFVFDTEAIGVRKGVRFRKGKTGEWRKCFTREQTELANAICGDVLDRHGWRIETGLANGKAERPLKTLGDELCK